MSSGLVLAIGLLVGWLLGRGQRWPWRRAGSGRPSSDLSNAPWTAWIEAAPQGWLVLDPSNTVRYLNPRAERLLGLPGDRLLRGHPLQEAPGGSELEDLVGDCRRQRRTQRLERSFGKEPLELQALPAANGWVGVVLQSRRSLEAQQEQQERWVSDVAHELRTPLTALILVGDRLASLVEGNGVVLVERLQRELQRLQLLVNDLLELSRLENTLPLAGGSYASLDLRELVESAWSSLRPLAEQRGIRLELEAAPMGLIWGDSSRLHRALLNLFDNAVRHSPDASAVEVRLESSGNACLLSVRDHGNGLSEADQERMFERFYRGDPSRGRNLRSGSGLGLAIVQQIALTHGGRVQGRNHAEGGAVMELLLPRGA